MRILHLVLLTVIFSLCPKVCRAQALTIEEMTGIKDTDTREEAVAKIDAWAASNKGGQADYVELSHGAEVSLNSLAVHNKITVVDFSSDYCGPCIQLGLELVKVAKAHPNLVAIRRVNINRAGATSIDWTSPVALEFGLHSIPYLVIFDKSGNKVAEGEDAISWWEQWSAKLS